MPKMKRPYQRFIIRSQGSRFWFWVFVYEELKDLRVDANTFGYAKNEEYSDCVGICQPYTRQVIGKNGEGDRLHANIGIIRLCREYSSTFTVSHEVMHAAFWLYRLEIAKKKTPGNANFGNEVSPREEAFAYLYGHLFRDMTRQMYKYKHWSS